MIILEEGSTEVAQVIQLQGFKSKAVQLTWFWIQGYEIVLSSCKDFDILSDMLAFSDFYDIQRPVDAIAKQIEAVEIKEGNLISAMALIDKLENIEACKGIATDLEARSKDFAVRFFNTPQKLALFVTSNCDNIDLVLRLLLKCDNFDTHDTNIPPYISSIHHDDDSDEINFSIYRHLATQMSD